jgi:DNA-binding response OmpR family regulator
MIPLRAAASVHIGSTAPRLRPLRDSSVVGSERARILLVEPDRRARSVIEASLLREGFEVSAVTTGEDAEREIASGQPLPSVVVCEATLRAMDGFAFCRQLRSEPRTSVLPVILLSRRPERYYARLASGAGADDFIAMPAFANDVVALVKLRAGSSSADSSLDWSTQDLPLPRLLRALLAGIRSGRIEIQTGGHVTFREGLVIDAAAAHIQGPEALRRILLLSAGDYTVTFSSAPAHATFSMTLEELCSGPLRAVEDWQRQLASGPPLDERPVVNFAPLGAVMRELPVGVRDLIRLCDGRRTVRQCLLDSSLSESLALASMARLQALGVVSFEDGSASQRAPSPAPSPADVDSPIPLIRAVDDKQEASERSQRPPNAPLELTEVEKAFFAAGDQSAASFYGHIPGAESRSPISLRFVGAAVSVLIVAAGAAWVTSKAATGRRLIARANQAGAVESEGDSSTLRDAPSSEGSIAGRLGDTLDDWLRLHVEGKAAEATQLLARLAQSRPSAATWLMLAQVRFDAGDHNGAEEAATRALELNPSSGRAMMLRASVFLARRDLTNAAAELQRYLKAEPDGPYAEVAKRLLSSW